MMEHPDYFTPLFDLPYSDSPIDEFEFTRELFPYVGDKILKKLFQGRPKATYGWYYMTENQEARDAIQMVNESFNFVGNIPGD